MRGHLRPVAGIGRGRRGHAAIRDAALQRGIDFGERDRHRRRAERLDQLGHRRRERAHAQRLEIVERLDRLIAEEHLRAERPDRQHLRAEALADALVEDVAIGSTAACRSSMLVETPIRSMPSRNGSSREASPTCVDTTSYEPPRTRRSASARLRPSAMNSERSAAGRRRKPVTRSIAAISTRILRLHRRGLAQPAHRCLRLRRSARSSHQRAGRDRSTQQLEHALTPLAAVALAPRQCLLLSIAAEPLASHGGSMPKLEATSVPPSTARRSGSTRQHRARLRPRRALQRDVMRHLRRR